MLESECVLQWGFAFLSKIVLFYRIVTTEFESLADQLQIIFSKDPAVTWVLFLICVNCAIAFQWLTLVIIHLQQLWFSPRSKSKFGTINAQGDLLNAYYYANREFSDIFDEDGDSEEDIPDALEPLSGLFWSN